VLCIGVSIFERQGAQADRPERSVKIYDRQLAGGVARKK